MKHAFRGAAAALLVASVLFSPLPLAGEGLGVRAPAPAAPVERYFLLLFDSPLGGMRQMDEVSATVEEWIAHELRSADAAAVVSYYGQELQIAQDFTRDRAALREAIDAAVRGQTRSGAPVEEGCPSLAERLPPGDTGMRQAESFYAALQVLAETVDSVPGPKGLLVFSKGFGRTWGISDEETAAHPVLTKYLLEPNLYEPTREALLSRRIRLYPVDLATDYREVFPLAGVMSRLAGDTGGRYVYPASELPRILERIAQAPPPAERPVELSVGITPPPPATRPTLAE